MSMAGMRARRTPTSRRGSVVSQTNSFHLLISSLKLPRTFWFGMLLISILVARLTAQEATAALKVADADYREGLAALSRGDLKTAQSKFELVVKLAPSAEQGHSALGAVLVRGGQTAAGIHELQRALAMKADDEAARGNLAVAYEQSGSAAKALPLFASLETDAQTKRQPLSIYLLTSYVRALAATGKSADAILR